MGVGRGSLPLTSRFLDTPNEHILAILRVIPYPRGSLHLNKSESALSQWHDNHFIQHAFVERGLGGRGKGIQIIKLIFCNWKRGGFLERGVGGEGEMGEGVLFYSSEEIHWNSIPVPEGIPSNVPNDIMTIVNKKDLYFNSSTYLLAP